MTASVIVVCGTDTGVGKTWLSTRLLRAWRGLGLRVAAYKPLESGTDDNPPEHLPADARALLSACDRPDLTLDQVCPWPLPRPVTPADELERLGTSISLDEIRDGLESLTRDADIVLVETAGGVHSPLTVELTSAAVANELADRVLLVGRNVLGTISATSTALLALQAEGTEVDAVALNALPGTRGPDRSSNARWISHLHPHARLFDVGHDDASVGPLAKALAAT